MGNPEGCGLAAAPGNLEGTIAVPIDPRLGAAQDNGGGAPTMVVLSGSPALDAGNPAAPGSGATACEATDARGVTRPQNSACEIGAYEHAGTIEGVVTSGGTAVSLAFVELLAADDGHVIGAGYTRIDGSYAIGFTNGSPSVVVRAHAPADAAVVSQRAVVAVAHARTTVNLTLP